MTAAAPIQPSHHAANTLTTGTRTANAHSTKNTARHYDLKVRRMDFSFDEDLPEFWYANDPYRTLLLASLSAGFPEGERFFIDSVRHFRDQIKDPALQKAISAFIGQEAHHSKEHEGLNALLRKRGYAVDKIDRGVGALMDVFRRRMSPERQLAHTVAIEHFTALMAEQFLLVGDELDSMDPRMATLWAWHAIEETEHKSVAFDVYKTVSDDEWIRLSQMALASVMFTLFSTRDFINLMRQSGQFGDIKMWLAGADHFWGRKGIFRKMIPGYLKFYRRDFHPDQVDSSALLEKIRQKYLGDRA